MGYEAISISVLHRSLNARAIDADGRSRDECQATTLDPLETALMAYRRR